MRVFSFIALALLVSVSAASAQTSNPSAVEFNSPDHAQVTSYELDLKSCVGTTCSNVIQTLTIQKSAVSAIAGTNPQKYRASINVQPIAFGQYVGVLRAIAGTVKSEDSPVSDIFNRTPGAPSKPDFK